MMTKKVALGLAGNVSQLTLSWSTSTYRHTTPITVLIYKRLQYYQQLSRFSGANYPPPSPAPPVDQSVLHSDSPQMKLYFKILN